MWYLHLHIQNFIFVIIWKESKTYCLVLQPRTTDLVTLSTISKEMENVSFGHGHDSPSRDTFVITATDSMG